MKQHKKDYQKMLARCRRSLLGAVRWWHQQDRQYAVWWRLANGAAVLLIVLSAVLPVAEHWYQGSRYRLSSAAVNLTGSTNQALLKQLTYDATKQQYQFNKDALGDSKLPAQLQKASVGTPSSKASTTYALDVPQDFSKGVTYHDVNSQLSFSLVPQFDALPGKQVNGHLVFPLTGGNQAIYTLKNNGLKEDIVVPKTTSATMSFSYNLNLPNTLEAKVIPDSGGAIGIYSADPALFGNISYGTSADQMSVVKARQASPKNYLVFGLPAPVIKAVNGKSVGAASARFVLSGHQLTVVAENLSGVTTPITIDPSVVVTSTSDFQTNGNNEANIDFSTAGQITRAITTSGGNGAGWSTGGAINVARSRHATVAYNGYLYILGGLNSSSVAINDVQYAPLTSGTVGAWHYTHNSTDDSTTFVAGFTTARYGLSAVVYNGYLYMMGGTTNGTTYLRDVQYAPLNANGTVGTWITTTSFATNRASFAAEAYNGYMYVYGGTTNGSAAIADVQFAPINADGSISATAWHYTHNSTDDGATVTSSLSGTGRYAFGGAVYNGYLYLMGGRDASTIYNDTQYAPLNANGTIGAWITTVSFPTARYYPGSFAYNGYLYVTGGYNGTSYFNDVQLAPINPNGSIGGWAASSSFPVTRYTPGVAAYNGYLYSVAGFNGTPQVASYYAKIDPNGATTSYSTVTSIFSPARAGQETVAYNGYLYMIGGETSSTVQRTDVQYAAFAANGQLGTWAVQTTAISKRAYFYAAAYNGYLYIYGGTSTGTNSLSSVQYAPIGSNGVPGTFVTSANSLGTARAFLAGAVYNGYLYAIGGYNAHSLATIEYTQIGSNGVPGTWATTSSMANARDSLTAAAGSGYVYVLGGYNDGTGLAYNDVYYAAFNANGTISATWTPTSSFTTARENLWSIVINNYLYVGGGSDSGGSNFYSDVQYALIGSNGSVGTFAAGPGFVTARRNVSVAYMNGYLYLQGGLGTGSYSALTQSAFVGNGGSGTLGTWSTTNAPLTSRFNQVNLAYNGYLYTLGGYDSSGNYLASVEYASIDADGTLSGWASTTSFIDGRRSTAAVAYNGYVYLLGGVDASANYLRDVQYAPINSNGTLGAWHYTHNSTDDSTTFVAGFTNGRQAHTSVAYNGYMYILGGLAASANYLNDVQYAPINSNGTLGAWHYTHNSTDDSTTFVAGFTTARYGHTSVAYNGHIYVAGGTDSSGTTYADVQYAPINSNGTIGTWATTTSFTTARYFQAMTVMNGYVYLLGGQNINGTNLNDVQAAPINSNGTLGAWFLTTSFTTARSEFGAVIWNGYIYALNGYSGSSTPQSDVQYSALNVIGRIGRYSKLIDFGVAVSVNSLTYNGVDVSGVSARAAGTSLVAFGPTIASTAIGTTGASCTQLGISDTRYLWVTITFDDSQVTFNNDASSPLANLSDFTVNYTPVHAAPNIRLRAGQTLQNGNLTGLDTCGP